MNNPPHQRVFYRGPASPPKTGFPTSGTAAILHRFLAGSVASLGLGLVVELALGAVVDAPLTRVRREMDGAFNGGRHISSQALQSSCWRGASARRYASWGRPGARSAMT